MAKRRRARKRAGSRKRDQVIKTGGLTSIRVPDGVELFRPDDATYKLDILLYEVGEGNPCAEKGEWYYERTFYIHRVGPENKYRICPLKTCGKPCPVCEDRAEMAKDPDGDEDTIRALRPKERQLWLVHDRDDDDTVAKLFEFSYHQFGRTLDELRQDADEDETHIIDFDDPDAGSTLRVKFSKNPPYGVETRSIEFRPRTKPLPEEWLDHGICLDDLLIVPDYDVLKREHLQIDQEDEDDDKEEKKEKSSTKRSRKKEESEGDDKEWLEEGADVIHEDMGVVNVTSLNKAKTKAKVEDSDGDVHTVEVDELKPVPDNACKACGGTGKSSRGRKCSPCKGTGVQQKDDDDEWEDEKEDKKKKQDKDDDDEWDEEDDDDIPFEEDEKEESGDKDDDDEWDDDDDWE